MILLIQPDDFLLNYVFFLEKKTNIIINGVFTKICFSDDCMIMNGIFINVPFHPFIKRFQSKNILFEPDSNRELIEKLSHIEECLLDYYTLSYNVLNKTPVFSLKTAFSTGIVKYYKSTSAKYQKYYIKISGVWETATEFGLTYKMIEY